MACLVLMLVGVPLGVASRRGGKSSGFVFTILLVLLYYFLSSTGIALGHQNKLPAFLRGVAGKILFAAAGIFLLWQMASGGRILSAIAGMGLARRRNPKIPAERKWIHLSGLLAGCSRAPSARARAASFRAFSTSTSCANSSPCSCWC